jgi:hypothetical protein
MLASQCGVAHLDQRPLDSILAALRAPGRASIIQQDPKKYRVFDNVE